MNSWIVLFVVITFVNADNLALLSGTLRTYQRAGCDDEVVTLRCPPGTSISIEVARYGKSGVNEDLCNPKMQDISRSAGQNSTCLWPPAFQDKWAQVPEGQWVKYSLLQTVVEACQKKRQCKFHPSPKNFGGDPCPGIRKYVEVAYKCRPYEFRSKIACEKERIQLKCNPNSRVAVYSASYGRTEYESFQCPQPPGVSEETCLVSYATETVMHICHGKRSCEITADANTFGSPCRPQSRMYLKIVYTCVPRKVLKDQYEGRLEHDEIDADGYQSEDEEDFDTYDSGKEAIRESAASPPAPNVENESKGDNLTKDFPAVSSKIPPHAKTSEMDAATLSKPQHSPNHSQVVTKEIIADSIDSNCTVSVHTGERPKVIGFLSEWINAFTFVSQNQERFYLYLILAVATGIVLCLLVLVGKLLVQKHRDRRDAKFHATNLGDNTLPNGFADDISEVDADIDLTTPLPVPSVTIHSPSQVGSIAEVVRYPHVHSYTMHRGPQDTDAPRSLNTATNSHYYYG